VAACPIPARSGASTRGEDGGSYCAIGRSASSQANTSSTARTHDAAKRIQTGRHHIALASYLWGRLRQFGEVEVEARQRPHQIGAPLAQPALQRVRVLHVLLRDGRVSV